MGFISLGVVGGDRRVGTRAELEYFGTPEPGMPEHPDSGLGGCGVAIQGSRLIWILQVSHGAPLLTAAADGRPVTGTVSRSREKRASRLQQLPVHTPMVSQYVSLIRVLCSGLTKDVQILDIAA
jgi:hypothetical protein